MNDIAAANDTSKARLYHYYEAKEATLFDLLDHTIPSFFGMSSVN